MSYDLVLFRFPEGEDPSVAFDELMAQQEEAAGTVTELAASLSEVDLARMRATAAALKNWRPELEQFVPETLRPWIELTDEKLQLQFVVNKDSVDVAMPYFRDWAPDMMATALQGIEVIRQSDGYSAYDPQLGKQVTFAEVGEMFAQYRSVDNPARYALEALTEEENRKKPWWKFW